MEEVINLLFPFISTPKDYDHVLKKLASFAFYETYIITLLLRSNPSFEAFFSGIESWGPIGRLVSTIPHHEAFNLFGLAIAFAVAVLTHNFQLHDRISDILRIRRRFDRTCILIPLADRVGLLITNDLERKIGKHQDTLMRAVFYKYASSRAEHTLVDKHDIEHALNAWSWFWVWVEGVLYFGLGTIISWLVCSMELCKIFAFIVVALLSLAFLQKVRLCRYARPQIASIAANAEAAGDVKQQFIGC